jgi:predicted Zn-dependent protease
LSFSFSKDHCLHLHAGATAGGPDALSFTQYASSLSNLSRVEAEGKAGEGDAARKIFGSPPKPDWCYFFLKAELAAQFGKWEEAVGYANEVAKRGLKPKDPLEWVPFAAAFANLGRYADAQKLIQEAFPSVNLKEGTLQMAHFHAALQRTMVGDPSDQRDTARKEEFREWVRTYFETGPKAPIVL